MRSFLVFLLLIAGVMTGACAPSASPPEETVAGAPSPAIAAPRDGARVAESPCESLLDRGEIRGLGLSEVGDQRRYLGVVECSWKRDGLKTLSMYIDPARNLLAETYRTWRGSLTSMTIVGMPSVATKSGTGEFNTCTVTTALAPTQALETTWVGQGAQRPENDACQFAGRAAAMVIPKLPPL